MPVMVVLFTLSGSGEINFAGGTNQLGYYVYGPTASIINNGTGAQDVSTAGFRAVPAWSAG